MNQFNASFAAFVVECHAGREIHGCNDTEGDDQKPGAVADASLVSFPANINSEVFHATVSERVTWTDIRGGTFLDGYSETSVADHRITGDSEGDLYVYIYIYIMVKIELRFEKDIIWVF